MIRYWLFHHAPWWQIWYPQSGVLGGLILGLIASLTVVFWRSNH